ncbi:endothelin-converting enzyme homolog isoform X2 [Neocloeon triangulifer]|uniref:endothelin-converting enzyme homolog isoform X2 n=1 Tax=Neocloeon triangulifer TaxID=2078957 RepID=UPI00286F8E45|nr:endothelin-converting enzyme homolog isoform X2 [Neocloeon triangulifer]
MTAVKVSYRPAESEDGDGSLSSRAKNSRNVFSAVSNYWKHRTTLEKVLLVMVTFLLVFTVILCIYIRGDPLKVLVIGSNLLKARGADGYCMSTACITAAASILQTMDHSVNPCDDFYQYSCGGWIKSTVMPEGKSLWGTFSIIEQQNQRVIRKILEQPSENLNSQAEVKAKMYYQSCMDPNGTIESLGATPLLEMLDEVGGWNVSGKTFNVTKWDLQKSLHILQLKYGMNGLFSWAVNEDDKNSSRYAIQIDQGGLTLPTTAHYLNKTTNAKVIQAYLEYMVNVGVLLGGEKNATTDQMREVINFETEIARITTPSDERRDEEKLYHSMSLTELQDLAPFMNWLDYFNEAFRMVDKKLTPNDTVIVYAPEYLHNLTKIISTYKQNETGKIVINNYLVWQMIHSMAFYLSKDFRQAFKGLRKVLTGTQGEDESWRYCVADTNSVLGFAVGAMFVREKFNNKSKEFAESMLNEIRLSLKENIENVPWMDDETKSAAISKANAITDMIGFPDYILSAKLLDTKYKQLEIQGNEYFRNNIRAIQFNLVEMLEKLNQSVNRTLWGMTPPTVNAYYNPTKNQIVFPAGILQLPFFDVNNPAALNFGGMGVVMGHELTHAFDDQGREYDKEGNLNHWWNNNTIEKFKQQTKCIVDQYANYKMDSLNLNGKQTLGENIADNGGLKAAFYAYQNWRQLQAELPLPGLDLSHNKLFFVNFAQVWCSASTTEANQLQIEKDPHSPSRFRVNGPVSNFPEFAKVFECPAGTAMNPSEKCSVW